ncbi:MAG: hypothetical protein A7315_09040 [Candidatus Altiarchaeales archaeon WOR_SM1_79]|nr:MAG: hypothetical protein A7315_09040 [Candidatus Altiarchaeales archaeon WOR_SM1_79]
MDLEGYCRRELRKGTAEEEILNNLTNSILNIKNLKRDKSKGLAKAVLEEVKLTLKHPEDEFVKSVLKSPAANISMGEMGVGSRGEGDFFVHKKIGQLASLGVKSFISPEAQDDSGAVETETGELIVVAIDGTHSRLSDYPFIAGFHVARAALRDIYVNGAKPVALLDDLHLADDGDVGRLFDFVAGISAVGELTGVPLIAGSTLRIGGDMVIGERMVSGVGAIGIARSKKEVTARRNVKLGDKILMTSGAGGGTIATTAIYCGKHDLVKETLNIDFIKACEAIQKASLLPEINAMLDVTNGGIRGDANEIIKSVNMNAVDIKRIINILKGDYEEFSHPDDPFRVLITTILSQRTRDEKTHEASENLFKIISTPEDVLKIDPGEVEKAIKQVGFYRVKARTIIDVSKTLIENHGGKVPDTMEELLKLKGVGRKTANCVLLFAYNEDSIPVDTHVHRISNRLGLVKTKTPEETERELRKVLPKKYWKDINCLFVSHGKNVCLPIKPRCEGCKIRGYCNYENKIGLIFYENKIKNLVNKKIYNLLKEENVDYLGVSIDSLMLFVHPDGVDGVIKVIENAGVGVDVVGEVVSGGKALLIDEEGKERELKPLFRESGYTKIKKVIGEKTPEEFDDMKENVEKAYKEAVEKRNEILDYVRSRG